MTVDRDYFPKPRLTKPAPGAPTFAQAIAAICQAEIKATP